MCEFYSSRYVTATRFPNRCEWCGQVIPPRSRAEYHAGKFEGDFFDGYFHMECNYAMKHADISQGYFPGEFTRGRADGENLPPEYDEYGNKI
jgi:hypothetical protein